MWGKANLVPAKTRTLSITLEQKEIRVVKVKA